MMALYMIPNSNIRGEIGLVECKNIISSRVGKYACVYWFRVGITEADFSNTASRHCLAVLGSWRWPAGRTIRSFVTLGVGGSGSN